MASPHYTILPHCIWLALAHRISLLTPSDSPISPKSPYKSHVNPSIRKPVENSNTTGAAPPEFSNESAPKRRSPRVQGKRKRDSEPHFANGSQLREAQERVEQKRAKIAARVPSAMAPGNVNATPTPVTSLADLYAQMRRDSDAPSQRDAASISSPSPTTAAPWNGRILHRRPQDNAPVRGVGHSVASSPDPIAMSEDDQEVVMVKHVRPSSPQVRPRLEQAMRLGRALPHLNLKSLSQAAKPMALTSTPKSSATDGVDKLLDKTRKAKPSFAVVVPSPPKRLTLKPTSSVERNTPGRHTSQSKDSTQAGTPVPNHTEKLKEITNAEAPESSVTHIPSSAPVPLTRSIESIPESIPDYAPRRLRRGMGASEDLTARDIDTLLGAVPIPFDFSLSHRHLTTHHHHDDDKDDDGERRDEESSLWWHHPIFEARAKADIRRTLGALLPADPAQDPPPITSDDLGGGGSWRAEVLPRQSGARMWAERLEDAFGPGPLDRGMGRKPRRVAVSLWTFCIFDGIPSPCKRRLVWLTMTPFDFSAAASGCSKTRCWRGFPLEERSGAHGCGGHRELTQARSRHARATVPAATVVTSSSQIFQ